ncbi:MAG: serine/threonine protein kinase, partial [Planctomyces sp.]
MVRSRRGFVWSIFPVLWVLCDATVCLSDDWLQWRGASGDGVSTEVGLPQTWSREKGVVWRVELPAAGNSTPVIAGDRI